MTGFIDPKNGHSKTSYMDDKIEILLQILSENVPCKILAESWECRKTSLDDFTSSFDLTNLTDFTKEWFVTLKTYYLVSLCFTFALGISSKNLFK